MGIGHGQYGHFSSTLFNRLDGETVSQTLRRTCGAIESVIGVKDRWNSTIRQVLSYLDYFDPATDVDTTVKAPALRFITIDMPRDVGFVYMLISLPNHALSYIGQTISISRRMREHNCITGGKCFYFPLNLFLL